MGDIGDVGRRQGMLFTTLSLGAILGPPISGLINTSTGGYTAVGFYAGKIFFNHLTWIIIYSIVHFRRRSDTCCYSYDCYANITDGTSLGWNCINTFIHYYTYTINYMPLHPKVFRQLDSQLHLRNRASQRIC